MRASFPEQPHALFVALQTLDVLFAAGLYRFRAEADDGVEIAPTLDVCARRPVAGFTTPALQGSSGGVEKDFPHPRVAKVPVLLFVTGFADLAAKILRLILSLRLTAR